MAYINTITGEYPITERQIRESSSLVYPALFNPPPEPFANVFPAPTPVYDPITQSVHEIAPALTVKGHYEQQYEIVALSEEQIAENRAKQTEQIQAAIIVAVQARLDDFAKTRNYDGILSACTYATSGVAKFLGEGTYCVGARDATWSALYAIMGEVLAGTRPMPSGYSDIESDLPVLEWPT